MTPAEAKALKVGDRVIFRGCGTMGGEVKKNNRLLCEIAWNDGVSTIVHHKHMAKFEREDVRKSDTQAS
jgi:hypothetical protein